MTHCITNIDQTIKQGKLKMEACRYVRMGVNLGLEGRYDQPIFEFILLVSQYNAHRLTKHVARNPPPRPANLKDNFHWNNYNHLQFLQCQSKL